ncbi:protein NYNRIN-like isoform X2 [Bufo gargarizans]|uniref:protein NYNRIN-like isoform X2 n=1 Tax=Bufo gargarizans TaxID=30331 RepID=UPI001CF36FA3|nr:protein NYNRIN-like isoform X2 [Bufo gargarizans]
MHKAMPDATERGTLSYVDDILIKSTTFEEHIAELRHVLTQLRNAGVKLSLQKAQWCRTKVNFLGHEITADGINPQKKKVEAVINTKSPTNTKELRSFLGMMNYSRKFIDNYAEITKPLLQLLKKGVEWKWSECHEQAVNELKTRLIQAPCLAYPEGGKPFYIETGFTDKSVSAVLFQKQDNLNKIIAYASKSLSPVEVKFNDCEKALLSTVWALQYFRSFIQGEKIIVETAHQPLQYLQSDRIKDGNLSNSRITAWTMSLMGWPLEIRYKQNNKNPVAQGLAELHDCSNSGHEGELPQNDFLEEQSSSPYKSYEEEYCKSLPCVYVDGCSFHTDIGTERTLVAGVGIVWNNTFPDMSVGYKIGPKSSQFAELTAVYKAVQMAIDSGLKEFVIITDSNYVHSSFVEYFPGWKRSNMARSNNKPVKHGKMFCKIDEMVTTHGLTIYWKKVRGHSKSPGIDKEGNDLADSLAKQAAINGEVLDVDDLMGTIQVDAMTRRQAQKETEANVAQWSQDSPSEDLIASQKGDPVIGMFYNHIEDPQNCPVTMEDCAGKEELRILMKGKSQFSLQDGLLVRTSKNGISQWVVPTAYRGLMLQHAHDAPTAGHRGEKLTYELLRDYAYWPHMLQDVRTYCQGCLICPQFQPQAPTHRAPLMKRGMSMPWSDIQIDFIGPVTTSSKGNRYMLTVTCLFTKWVECLPCKTCSSSVCASLLINHVFSRFGLPQRIESDRGSHFTSEVMTKTWEILGVKRKLHIAYRPASSGGVERYNQTIVNILKKFVNESGRKMVLPQHLLYRTTDQNLINASTAHQYIENLRKHLQHAFAFAQKNLEKAAVTTSPNGRIAG